MSLFKGEESFGVLSLAPDVEAIPAAIRLVYSKGKEYDRLNSSTLPLLDLLVHTYIRRAEFNTGRYNANLLYMIGEMVRTWDHTSIYIGRPESGPKSLHLCWNDCDEHPFINRIVVMTNQNLDLNAPQFSLNLFQF